jgi:hypothetical protein
LAELVTLVIWCWLSFTNDKNIIWHNIYIDCECLTLPDQVGTLINLRTIGSGSGQQVRGWVGLREPFAIGVTGFTRAVSGCGHPISAGGFGCGQPFEQSAWRKQQRAYHRELLVWRGFAVVVTTSFHTGGW